MVRELYLNGLREVAHESLAVDWQDNAQRGLAKKVFVLAEGQGLTWAREDMLRNIYALDDADAVGNAIVVLMTPLQAVMRSSLRTDTSATPPQIMIGPHLVSQRWAGIALGHELIHVHDVLEGIEPPSPNEEQWFAGEARAFRWEAQLVDALSGGAFSDRVAEVLSAHSLVGMPPATALHEVATALRTATFAPPLSTTERGQQDAFCAVAALFARRGELWEQGGSTDDFTDLKSVLNMP